MAAITTALRFAQGSYLGAAVEMIHRSGNPIVLHANIRPHPMPGHFRIRILLVLAVFTVVSQTAIPNGRVFMVLFLVPIVAILLGGKAYFLELLRLGIPWRFRHSAQVMALWLVVGAFMHLVMRLVCFVGIPLQNCNTGGFGTHAFGVLAFFVIFLPVALVAPSDWRRLHSSKAENKSAE